MLSSELVRQHQERAGEREVPSPAPFPCRVPESSSAATGLAHPSPEAGRSARSGRKRARLQHSNASAAPALRHGPPADKEHGRMSSVRGSRTAKGREGRRSN